ncbi:F0F1 ATP synthase subunit B [Streptomyces radicis]|uniref:F0F1 ATP synthase subunit B n=1 Tax=Streptomyces radicis TaxID=1750517 RepID=UPI001601DF1E|nr:F0F1 ATP synthase subunit B [Streptomyces radicis]
MIELAAEEPQSPVVPVVPEIVIGLICFGVIFFVFYKKLVPSINKVLEERRAAIEGGMEKAEAVQAEARQTLESYKEQLAEARHEAARMRQEAQEQGAALIAEMREEGQRQREEIIAAGHTQIAADRKQAAELLRQDVGNLAIELAGKLVGESLEDHARQSRTIDRFLDDLERQAEGGVPAQGQGSEAGR